MAGLTSTDAAPSSTDGGGACSMEADGCFMIDVPPQDASLAGSDGV